MPDITVRNLPSAVHRGLKERAARHGRSMEAEARAILESALSTDPVVDWVHTALALDVGEWQTPPRSAPRDIDLS